MRKLTILVFLTLICGVANSQNIYSALQLNQEREYKTRRPKKIVETNIFFNESGKQVDKNEKTFDAAGMLLIEERFDETGKIKARLSYNNDTVKRIIQSRTFERWNQFGSSKETAFYSYNSNNYLVGIADKDSNGNILCESTLICNDKGHPIQISLFDRNGYLYGIEKAIYLYDRNKCITSVISNDGSILSTDTITISYKNAYLIPSARERYNANGDEVSWTRQNQNGTEILMEEEYIYDEYGNCTENKIYEITIKTNGKQKKEIDRIFKKEYIY
jgi:hypothetical protein